MCNRYRLEARSDELFDFVDLITNPPTAPIAAEYFPGQPVPVVRAEADTHRLDELTWGFPPFKSKRPINNTRSEKAATSPFWQRHLNTRCVFPISEAIEWQHQVNRETGELRKVPHTIRFRDSRIGAVAGIYTAQDSGCCSMLTCPANSTWATIHNSDPADPRMVCFLLDPEAIGAWLDPGQPYEAVRHLLRPMPELDLLVTEPIAR